MSRETHEQTVGASDGDHGRGSVNLTDPSTRFDGLGKIRAVDGGWILYDRESGDAWIQASDRAVFKLEDLR